MSRHDVRPTSGSPAQRRQTFATQVIQCTLPTCHRQDQRREGATHFRAVAMNPITVTGPKTEAGDPSLGSDQQVRLRIVVRNGAESLFGVFMLKAQGAADVFAMDDDLAQHDDDGGRWTVRGRGPPRGAGRPALGG